MSPVTIHGFVISLSNDQIADDLYTFASKGQVWGVSKYLVGHAISAFISEIFMDIINTVEEVNMVKIHSQTYFQSVVESTFSIEYGLQGNLFVMLYIDNEMKVEQFEGEKRTFLLILTLDPCTFENRLCCKQDR